MEPPIERGPGEGVEVHRQGAAGIGHLGVALRRFSSMQNLNMKSGAATGGGWGLHGPCCQEADEARQASPRGARWHRGRVRRRLGLRLLYPAKLHTCAYGLHYPRSHPSSRRPTRSFYAPTVTSMGKRAPLSSLAGGCSVEFMTAVSQNEKVIQQQLGW